MTSAFFSYPDGAAGLGLLLFRLAVAGSLLALPGMFAGPSDWRPLVVVPVAVGLCAGWRTRLFAVAGVAAVPILAWDSLMTAPVLLLLVDGAALALMGPGAFSADARLFGRRTLFLPDRRDPPASSRTIE
jgi:hypothetical protein